MCQSNESVWHDLSVRYRCCWRNVTLRPFDRFGVSLPRFITQSETMASIGSFIVKEYGDSLISRTEIDLTPALPHTVRVMWRELVTTSFSSFCLSPVVTGATDGIGKSYAEEVRLLDPYLFHFFHGKAVTHAYTHRHTHIRCSLIGHGRGELLQAY